MEFFKFIEGQPGALCEQVARGVKLSLPHDSFGFVDGLKRGEIAPFRYRDLHANAGCDTPRCSPITAATASTIRGAVLSRRTKVLLMTKPPSQDAPNPSSQVRETPVKATPP